MVLQCNKCKKILTSTYNYDRHVNRKTPCDLILQCIRCDKIFKETYQLDNHESRKFPCKITNLNFDREQREKDRELKLHLENQRNATKEKEIIAKENKSIRETAARAANTQKQMEIAQLKCNNKLELAQVIQSNKISLKEQFPSAVTNITNITNTFINSIQDTYFITNDTCFTKVTEYRIKRFKEIQEYNQTCALLRETNWYIEVFNKYDTTQEIVKHFLRHAYLSNTELNTRCIYYHEIIDQFYAVYITDVKKLQPIDYRKDLHEEFISCIKLYTSAMLDAVKDLHYDINNNAHAKPIGKINEMKQLQRVLHNIQNYACSTFIVDIADAETTKIKHIRYKEADTLRLKAIEKQKK